jgi:hypothetical protein
MPQDAFDGLSAPWRGSPSRLETTTTHAGESMRVCARHHGLTWKVEFRLLKFLANIRWLALQFGQVIFVRLCDQVVDVGTDRTGVAMDGRRTGSMLGAASVDFICQQFQKAMSPSTGGQFRNKATTHKRIGDTTKVSPALPSNLSGSPRCISPSSDDHIAEQRGPVFSLYFHPAMGVVWHSRFRFRPTYPSAAILSQMRLYVLKPST